MYDHLIGNNIFTIPAGAEYGRDDDSICIVYAPFTDRALMMTPEYVRMMDGYLEDPQGRTAPDELDEAIGQLLDPAGRKTCAPLAQSPYEYRRLAILPNNKCNFSCSYCYSARGRSGKVIGREVLKAGLDLFIDPVRVSTDHKLAVSILGGGEPLLSWDLVRFIIEYSGERARTFGFRGLDCNVVTNGSVLTQEMIDTLKKYRVPVSVSFEILEDIQNLQRGHYERVARNIDRMIAEGIRPQLRATITEGNIGLMKRMIEEVLERFPGTREVMMEYVTDPATMIDPARVRKFYRLYIDHFFEAHDHAAAHGLLLDCSAYRNFHLLIERFCPGDNTLTPDGEISICSRIGSAHDLGYADSIYGRIDADGTMAIDRAKFDRLMALNVHHDAKCSRCFAKWHCAGGCMIHRHTYSEDIRNEICEYTRSFTKRMLLRNIEKEYAQHYGVALKDAIGDL